MKKKPQSLARNRIDKGALLQRCDEALAACLEKVKTLALGNDAHAASTFAHAASTLADLKGRIT